MDSSQTSIQCLVKKIKEEMFSTTIDVYSFVSPSSYDTAWLAMIPDGRHPDRPMFRNCVDWILANQKEEGFWGETDSFGGMTSAIDCLPATLACMVALKKWNGGEDVIEKGLAFIHAKADKLLHVETHDEFPRWFTIVFPAMLELAREVGLEIVLSEQSKEVMTNLFMDRQRILEKGKLVDKYHYPPLISYVEALPSSYDNCQDDIVIKHLSCNGSLFQSPSATARTFMSTGNKECLRYLQTLVQRFPAMYPMDEDLINLCIVNQIQSLGLAEHFIKEIQSRLKGHAADAGACGPQIYTCPKSTPNDHFHSSLLSWQCSRSRSDVRALHRIQHSLAS